MNKTLLKPFLVISAIVLAVSMACMSSAPKTDPTEPPEKPVEKATKAPEPTEEPKATEAPAVPSGAVTSLEDIQEAMVFITVEGTWRDPEGWGVNMGYIGSGFIIDPSGIAVTNNHVVTGAALIKVYVGGSDEPLNARILGVSECSDLAVIDIEGDGFPYLQWYEDPIKVGTNVFAVGYPGGLYTMTDGIISATDAGGRTVWSSVDYVLQHTAKINPGNSGGPLVSEDGKVVGVNYASISTADRNFAISPGEAKPIIEQLQAGKDVDSIGINGVTLYDYTDEAGNPLYGIWVRSVNPGSPADKARIVAGDILYQMAGQVLATDGTMGDYCDVIRSHGPGDTVDIVVIRYDSMTLLEGQLNGRELEAAADLGGNVAEETENQNLSSDTYSGYMTVTDDTGAIQISVPNEWVDINGSNWVDDNDDPLGAAISAAANLQNFNDTWYESGVFFSASRSLVVNYGGYVQILDAFKSSYVDTCTYEGRNDYEDQLYHGKYDLFSDCDGSGNVFILLTAAPDKSTDFVILLMMNITKDADFEALDQMLASFEVIGRLP